MSFKRDGDDHCALNNQRKRRVEELLYDDIEKDEVSKLSNGRYVCKVCPHKPIFDTLKMFFVHRQGKKHQQSVEYSAAYQQELEDLVVKRRHENLAQTEQDSRTDYQGCETKEEMVKRTQPKKNLYSRKPVLDLEGESALQGHSSVSIATTQASLLPGNRNRVLNKFNPSLAVAEASKSSRDYLKADALARDTSGSCTSVRTKPGLKGNNYSKPFSFTNADHDTVIKSSNVAKFMTSSDSQKRNLHYLSRKKQKLEAVSSNSSDPAELPETSSFRYPEQTWEYYKNHKGLSSYITHGKTKPREANMSEAGSCEQQSLPLLQPDAAKKEKAEKFLHAFSSGWKKDRDGSWIKDEDAEFDSDEEPPDVT